MCGIVAMIAKGNSGFFSYQASLFDQMMYATELRGEDSTGVCLIDTVGNVLIHKEDTRISDFRHSKEYIGVFNDSIKYGKVVIGHCRKATVGTINEENAHPFVIDNELVLVHNGSLYAHKHLCEESEVDSRAIASHLHKNWDNSKELKTNLELIDKISGAYALIWYDVRDNCLNIVRNSQRPLFMIDTPSAYFFASEKKMMEWVFDRNNDKYTKIEEVPSRKLHRFDLTSKGDVTPTISEVPFAVYQSSWKPGNPYTKAYFGMEAEDHPFTGADLSKNRFKKESSKLVGQVLDFFVDDFTDYSGAGGELSFYGTSPGYQVHHEIIGIASEDLSYKVINNNNFARGKVTNVEYKKSSRKMVITVEMMEPAKYETSTIVNNAIVQ